jgi:HSP20 family molecular chaperone IbpA
MAIKKKRPFSDVVSRYFEDLEEEFDRWRETLMERPSWNSKACSMEPLHDVKVTPMEVVVTVDLPLTVESSLQVKPLGENTLEISAEMKRKIQFKELGITHQEGEFHKLHCHMRVPVPVHMDKMKMRFKKGMLEIHLPRKHKK